MNYGRIKYFASEDGIGLRTAIFVSGCRNCCPGCIQPQTWDFSYGSLFTKETEQDIICSMKNPYTDGITLLGGEPFEPENQEILLPFLMRFKTACPEKTIWAYSGCTFEELTGFETNDSCPYIKRSDCHTENTIPMLCQIDILVDGRFIAEQKNLMLPFRGSENQRILDVPKSLEKKQAVLSRYHYKNNAHTVK